MDQGQKFKPAPLGTTLEEKPFEFKPLDLSSVTGQSQQGACDAPKRTRKVRVPCPICAVPGCYLEKEVEVADK